MHLTHGQVRHVQRMRWAWFCSAAVRCPAWLGFLLALAYTSVEFVHAGTRLRRGEYDIDADRGEHRIEPGCELGVSVADQIGDVVACPVKICGEVAGQLSYPGCGRVGGDAVNLIRVVAHEEADQDARLLNMTMDLLPRTATAAVDPSGTSRSEPNKPI